MIRVMKCWNKLSKQVGEVPSLETFKVSLQGSKKPKVLEAVPVHSRRVGLHDI